MHRNMVRKMNIIYELGGVFQKYGKMKKDEKTLAMNSCSNSYYEIYLTSRKVS